MRWGYLSAALFVAAAALVGTGVVSADLALGKMKIESVKPPRGHPLTEIKSGYLFRSKETQQFQDDDYENPGFIWYDRGEVLWSTPDGEAGRSCASCHGDAATSMRTTGARLPKWSDVLDKPINLEQQINLCRTERMKAPAWKFESEPLISMAVFVRAQARGQPVRVQVNGRMSEWIQKGDELYHTRFGQLQMACASCHESNYGKYLRAEILSQGQSNGFPTYRLAPQSVTSLHNRFRICMRQIRAEPFEPFSDEYIALELYLAWRGIGLPVETPAVRQ